MICIAQLLEIEVAITLCFHLFNTQHYKQRAVQEVSLQSIQSLRKIQEISQHSYRDAASYYRESTPCVVSKKNWNTKEDKGKSMMRALHVLWLV